jgi:hypothetical protein
VDFSTDDTRPRLVEPGGYPLISKGLTPSFIPSHSGEKTRHENPRKNVLNKKAGSVPLVDGYF